MLAGINSIDFAISKSTDFSGRRAIHSLQKSSDVFDQLPQGQGAVELENRMVLVDRKGRNENASSAIPSL